MTGKRLAFLAITLLLAISACSAQPTQLPPTPSSAPTQAFLPLSEQEVPRVTLEDARAALEEGSAVLVDVRSADAFAVSHIAGAINIGLGEFETNPNGLNLPKDQWIITYCTWLNEHTSARAAFILLHNGYPRVSALLGGFAAWIEAGYPVEP